MQTCDARIACIGTTVLRNLVENESARAMEPPGVTLFSTLFYVAAIGGKSPRVFSCDLQSGV